MIKTQDFCTRTQFVARKNVSVNGYWPIGLDIGYSAVKGMSPNMVYCFPSFARLVKGEESMLSSGDPDRILYKSENGSIWSVGAKATLSIGYNDTQDSEWTLYGRHRYESQMFLVLARVGLAMGMTMNEYGVRMSTDKVRVLTGLPPAYINADSPRLKNVLARSHRFEIKIGNGPWQLFTIDLEKDDIMITDQPMGSYLSLVMNSDATYTSNSEEILAQNAFLFDAGFGTTDIFTLNDGFIESTHSFDNMGMKAVLQETSDSIYKKYNVAVPVHAMQRALKEGAIEIYDRVNSNVSYVPFVNLLEDASKTVFEKVYSHIVSAFDLTQYKYFLITGGTGAAWLPLFKERMSGMRNLTIVTGSANDTLPHVYSNVRGFYLYLVNSLRSAES